MHDTVNKVYRRIREESIRDGVALTTAMRLESADLSRALTQPLSAHLEVLYQDAFRWIQFATRAVDQPGDGNLLGELAFASVKIHETLEELEPFLERAEDILSERDEITHRESSYDREVAPFSRLETSVALRDRLATVSQMSDEDAAAGAQALGDLLKVVYLENAMREGSPKPIDLYAMTAELGLDARRHLMPTFNPKGSFVRSLRTAAGA